MKKLTTEEINLFASIGQYLQKIATDNSLHTLDKLNNSVEIIKDDNSLNLSISFTFNIEDLTIV